MTKSINLCNLPRFIDTGNKGKINWKESVGYKVSFQYGYINDTLEIIGYDSKRKSIIIKYKEKELKIGCSHFIDCRRGIPIEVFNNKNELLGVYKSASEVSRISLSEFGVKLSQTAISSVCRGEADSHKGFKFKIRS